MAQNKSYKELMELQGQSGGQQGTGTQTSNQMLDLILNRKPFQYNATTDPGAQAARKTAARNAQAVTRDTLGKYAGMTGGVPSTAAVSAATQAGNAAMQQGADRVAELEQLAYQNYQTEGQDMYKALAAMQGAEGDAWSRQMQEQQWQHQKEQDAKADADAEYQKKLALAQLAAAYGDDRLLKELGIDTSNYGAGGYSGGGGGYRGSGGGGGGGSGSGGGDDDGNNAALAELLTAYPGKTLTASEWAAAAAQYGEQFLIDNGFSKRAEQKKPSSGGGAGTGGGRPGAGSDRTNMMI